jgi:hypothetical protein
MMGTMTPLVAVTMGLFGTSVLLLPESFRPDDLGCELFNLLRGIFALSSAQTWVFRGIQFSCCFLKSLTSLPVVRKEA